MLFSAEALESEICKLRGLLQMLHEDQPDVLEDVFEFHVGNLISHSSPDHHAHIRTCAQEMLVATSRGIQRARLSADAGRVCRHCLIFPAVVG